MHVMKREHSTEDKAAQTGHKLVIPVEHREAIVELLAEAVLSATADTKEDKKEDPKDA
jgi:hypothetical protein